MLEDRHREVYLSSECFGLNHGYNALTPPESCLVILETQEKNILHWLRRSLSIVAIMVIECWRIDIVRFVYPPNVLD